MIPIPIPIGNNILPDNMPIVGNEPAWVWHQIIVPVLFYDWQHITGFLNGDQHLGCSHVDPSAFYRAFLFFVPNCHTTQVRPLDFVAWCI